MEETTKKYSRNKLHELAMVCLYQFLVYLKVEPKPDLKAIIEGTMDQPLSEVDPLIKQVVVNAVSNFNTIIDYLSQNLVNDWDFNRLNYLNQAILILGYVEIKYCKVPKPVAINVCIKLAQKFSDDDAYKIINGVLDTINIENE
jgi:N utilization substance protein B